MNIHHTDNQHLRDLVKTVAGGQCQFHIASGEVFRGPFKFILVQPEFIVIYFKWLCRRVEILNVVGKEIKVTDYRWVMPKLFHGPHQIFMPHAWHYFQNDTELVKINGFDERCYLSRPNNPYNVVEVEILPHVRPRIPHTMYRTSFQIAKRSAHSRRDPVRPLPSQ